MYYTVKEFMENFEEKIDNLGINPMFKENPAYPILLVKFKNLIGLMNILNDENVFVKQEDKTISFKHQSSNGDKNTISFFCPDANTFECINFCEKEPRKTTENVLREKSVCDRIIRIDPSIKFIDYYENNSKVYGNYKRGIKIEAFAEHDHYIPGGIVSNKEARTFDTFLSNNTYDSYGQSNMLYIPANLIKGFYSNYYNSREIMIRDQLDVAKYTRWEKRNGQDKIVYSIKTPLSTENGLMDMYQIGGGPYREMEIQPLSKERIERLIKMHVNPKTQDALRQFAKDRDKFYYNSYDDKSFVYKFYEPSIEHKPRGL